MRDINIEIAVLSDADAEIVASSFEAEGASLSRPDAKRVEPMTILAGVLALIAAARAVADFACKLRSGVVVDTRSTPVTVTSQEKLPKGTLVIVGANETVVEDCTNEKLSDLVEAAMAAGGV